MGDGADHPDDRKYFKEHEWVKPEGGNAKIGLSAYAAEALGDIVFVDLPSEGANVIAQEQCGEVESVKSVSSLHSPVSGKVISVNRGAVDSPEIINSSPNGEGWLIEVEMSDPSEVDGLMSSSDYTAYVETL